MIFEERKIRFLALTVLAIILVFLSLIYVSSKESRTDYLDTNDCKKGFVVYSGRVFKGVVLDKFLDKQNHATKTLVFLLEDGASYCFQQDLGGVKSLYHLAFAGDSVFSSKNGYSLILKKGDKEFEYAIYQTEGYNGYSEHK